MNRRYNRDQLSCSLGTRRWKYLSLVTLWMLEVAGRTQGRTANTMSGILVTGAAGFIGRHTCSELRRHSLQFVGIDVGGSDEVRVCDLADRSAVSSLLRFHEFDAVIHLAAILPSASAADPLLATRVNISAAITLLHEAISSGVRRFVFGSSTSVYGFAGVTVPVSEDIPAAPSDVYGAAKRFVEIVGENLNARQAIEFSALRIATVVGPGARNTSSPWRSEIFEKLGTGVAQQITLPYYGQDLLTVVHVEEVARMLKTMVCADSLTSCLYNTPAELCSAKDLKGMVEAADPDVQVVLTERRRPLAPLADGTNFATEFSFETPSLASRLEKAARKGGTKR